MPHILTPDLYDSVPTTAKNLPPLYVNDGLLDPSEVGHLKPSSPNLPLSVLRERYESDGYLFLKQVLPRHDILKAREEYFKFLSPSGVLAPQTDAVSGIFDASKPVSEFPGIGAGSGEEGQAEKFVSLALEAHSQKWYTEDLCHHPALWAFVAKFTGWGEDTLTLRRTLLRNNIPGTQAVGVHYDQIYLRHGEPTSVTVWVPMGDIKVEGGGLIYLEHGTQLGRKFESDFTEKARASGLSNDQAKSAFNQNMLSTGFLDPCPGSFGRQFNSRWLVSAYEAGDVVLHNPYTIHASTVNHDPDHAIRLATDIRFVDKSKPWDKRWEKTYELNDGA